MPPRTLISGDLPAPTSPRLTSKLTPLSAFVPPNDLATFSKRRMPACAKSRSSLIRDRSGSLFSWSSYGTADRAPIGRLEPAFHLEPDQGNEGAEDDHRPAILVAPGPVVFRHVLEVHAIDSRHQGRGDADDR